MKKFTFTLLLCSFFFTAFAQDFSFMVRPTYKKAIKKETLITAENLSDLNPGFPSSWISDYVSVEVATICNGKDVKAVGKNDILSAEQRKILSTADLGADVKVEVKYTYKSSGAVNVDLKTISFTRTLIPKFEAEYIGGEEKMNQYFKENAIDKIPEAVAKKIEMGTVLFTVDEEGGISNVHISESSGDEKIDQVLLEAVTEMPKWKPAEDVNGEKAQQTFELSVGTFIGC